MKIGAAAALGDEIEAVIEELAEECHPGVERRRQPCIRGDVLEEEYLPVVSRAELAVQSGAANDVSAILQHIIGGMQDAVHARVIGRGIGRRIVSGLIDDQVAEMVRGWESNTKPLVCW